MKTEFNIHQHDINLMAALGFDDDDLDANRHGYMSKKQRRTLSHIRRVWKLLIALAILATPLALFYAIMDGYRIHDTPGSRFGVCVLIIIIASAISFHGYIKVQRFNNDLLKGDVLNVGGTVRRDYVAGRGQEAIHVADKVFRTSEPYRFYGFALGQKYRIFYAPFSKYILSAQLFYKPESEQEIPTILKANPPIN